MRKTYRIKKEREFQRIFEHGQSVANRYFVIYQLPHLRQHHFRVGISVGKKVGHTAVLRNQIKRYIRQSLLELTPQMNHEIDFLVISRPYARQLSMVETKENLQHVLLKSHILRPEQTL